MKKFLSLAIIGILILVMLIYIFYFRPYYFLFNGGKIEFNSEIRKELFQNQYVDLMAHKDAIYYCSQEGLEKKDLAGQSKWTKPFQMLSPVLKRAGDYFVVADVLGHDAYIFHESGYLTKIRENLPIISATINAGGYLVLVLESDLENKIKIYTKEGTPLIERGSVFRQDGYPVAISLSEDGIHLTTSFADALHVPFRSKITMFGFADYHEDLDEFIIRADSFEQELVPELHYFQRDALWLVGTKAAYVYPMSNSKEIYGQIKKIELPGEILQVFYMDSQILFYMDTKQIEQKYALQLYDKSGERVHELFFDRAPQLIRTGSKNYYVFEADKVSQYRDNKILWQYPFYDTVEDFYELDGERFLLVQPMSYTVWKLKQIY